MDDSFRNAAAVNRYISICYRSGIRDVDSKFCAAGLGTALVYPTLLASISDISEPTNRASALGVYRFWRDSGYAAGGICAGILSDIYNMSEAILIIAALTFVSGIFVAVVMRETLRVKERYTALSSHR